jgi:hypothetical protein
MSWKINAYKDLESHETITRHGRISLSRNREFNENLLFELVSFEDEKLRFYYNITYGFISIPAKNISKLTPDETEEYRKFVELKEDIMSVENTSFRYFADKALNHLEFYLRPKKIEHMLYTNTKLIDNDFKNVINADFIILGPKNEYIQHDLRYTDYESIDGYALGFKIYDTRIENIKKSFSLKGPFTHEKKGLYDIITSDDKEWKVLHERPAEKNPIRIIGEPLDYIIKTVNQSRNN